MNAPATGTTGGGNRVSVVIPVFRREDVFGAIDFLSAQPLWPRLRPIVVDNGNPPELSARLRALGSRGVEVVSLPENRGGSGAYIAGVEHAMREHGDTELVWLLDDDAVPDARTLPALLEVYAEKSAETDRVAAVVSTIVSKRKPGVIVESGVDRFFGKPVVHWNRGKRIEDVPDETRPVVYGAAASMLVSKACIRACGFFENLFIHCDDIEWGYRVTQRCGWKIFATTRSAVVHPEFTGVGKSGAWISYYDDRNGLWFCKKHAPERLRSMLRRTAVRRLLLRLHGDKATLPYLRLALRDFRSGRLRLRSELPDLALPTDVDWNGLDGTGGVALVCQGRRTLAFVRSKLPHCRIRSLVYDDEPEVSRIRFLRRYLVPHLALQVSCWLHPRRPVLFDHAFSRRLMLPLFSAKKTNVAFECIVPDPFPDERKWMSFPWDVCIEHDAIRARLRADPAAWAAGKDECARNRFAACEARLALLSGAEKRAFRRRLARELRRGLRTGELDEAAFAPPERRRIRRLVRSAGTPPERIAAAVSRLLPAPLRRAAEAAASRVWFAARSAARRIRG